MTQPPSGHPRDAVRPTALAGEELADFLENAGIAMHWVGPDGTILWANRAELDLLGYTAEEYIGRHIADFHVDRPVVDDILARLWRNERLRDHEARLRHKNGETRDVLISSSVMWRGGEFVHTRCLTRDVTAQKRLDAERRRAARHLATEYRIVKILSEARSFREAVPLLLRAIGEAGDWQFAALWRVDEVRNVIRCADACQCGEMRDGEFEAVTRQQTFARGEGFPGRIWQSGQPSWIDDFTATELPRAPAAARAGLRGAFGFPIRAAGRVVAVAEFFSLDVRAPDPGLLELFDALGTQIGQFAERSQAAETRERLASIIDSSEDAIVTKTLDGVITSWNRGAERIFGYTAAEAIGQPITLIIPDDRLDEEREVLARLRRGERVDHFETERQTKDGRRVNISLAVSPVRLADGEIVGASKVARDITERKRLEELTATLNRVGATVASTLDRNSILQAVTDMATELTAAEFGAFFYNVIDAASGEAYLLYTLSGVPKEAFASFPKPRATALFGPTFRGEAIIRLDDVTTDPRYGHNPPYHGLPPGHLPVRSYLAAPVKSRSGEVLGGLFFGHSRTAMFTAEHERIVEGIVSWAAMALENARLYADVEQAVRARDEFLSIASHELRNPLNAIQLQLVGLHRAALESTQALPRELVCSRIGEATEDVARLVRLVHNLLDVSRITAGRLDLEPEEVDLRSVVETAAARCRPQPQEGQLTLTLAPVTGRWDRMRLDQIVSNRLSNAVKYGRDKPIDVGLRADAHTAFLTVTDRGIGIPLERQQRLFERFERGVPKQQYAGFGLGLWITHRVVEAMRGAIAVDSRPGEGTTFTVALPRNIESTDGPDIDRRG